MLIVIRTVLRDTPYLSANWEMRSGMTAVFTAALAVSMCWAFFIEILFAKFGPIYGNFKAAIRFEYALIGQKKSYGSYFGFLGFLFPISRSSSNACGVGLLVMETAT